MNRVFFRKSLIGVVIVATVMIFGAVVLHYRSSFLSKIYSPVVPCKKKEPWMTVFVHGTFGSLLGFLSMNNVLKDKISGTIYRKTTKLMRDDEYFFADQPILRRGLVAVDPTLDIIQVQGKKFGVHPIIGAYKKISEAIRPGCEENYFYTFGWSGLLSQNSRRFEAIRFYNALSEELEVFAKKGIFPKIRIIAHSHGGNLALNLAAISDVINKPALGFKSKNEQGQETCEAIFAMMKDLTTRESAKNNADQKIYDYVPIAKSLRVADLIMFGTPIQPETEPFCESSFFGKVYNFYSDEDMVQRADWVSSKKPVSERRLSNVLHPARVVQGRIMINPGPERKATGKNASQKKPEEELGIFERIMAGFTARQTKDPTHKELWFLSWDEYDKQTGSFLVPLPVVVLTPLLTRVSEKQPLLSDIDLHIKEDGDKVSVCATKYDDDKEQSMHCMSYQFLSALKEEVKPYRPEGNSHITLFDTVYKHLLKAGYEG